jgi:LysM repeat protein
MKSLVLDFEAVSLGDSLAKDSSTKNRKVDSSGLTAAVIHNDTPPTPRINPTPSGNPRNASPSRQPQRGEITHTVRSGENLYRIAQRYHVTHEAIAKRNKLNNPRSLRPGQRLIIPAR